MKIALNNQNVTLKNISIIEYDCFKCCFSSNLSLCWNLELRDRTICRTTKVLNEEKLKEVFKL